MCNVFLVADKYDVAPLRSATKEDLIGKIIPGGVFSTTELSSSAQERLVRMIGEMWTWEMKDASEFQNSTIMALMDTSLNTFITITEIHAFQALLDKNKAFNMGLIQALAFKAWA